MTDIKYLVLAGIVSIAASAYFGDWWGLMGWLGIVVGVAHARADRKRLRKSLLHDLGMRE